eukprot:GEZU01008220.1.p1 GENE.GEZU01008220.1~~GEZU01008220.1.p1  ORF type:complete len:214 (-),score=51.77 GEZU01008220.1:81-722(-)
MMHLHQEELQHYRNTVYKIQSGCIPVKGKIGSPSFRVMLVTNWKGKRWVFPKGSVKHGESKKEAAKRETEEEAGIKGKIKGKVGIVYDDKDLNTIHFYCLKVKKIKKSQWEESTDRKRKWFTVEEALAKTQHRVTAQALQLFVHYHQNKLQEKIQQQQQEQHVAAGSNDDESPDAYHVYLFKGYALERWFESGGNTNPLNRSNVNASQVFSLS